MRDEAKLALVHWALAAVVAALFVWRGEPDLAAGVLFGIVISMVGRP